LFLSDSIIIIPTYNEKENIGAMIEKVFSLPNDFHILIIDDGSPDGTPDIVKQYQLKFSGKLFIEERKGKQGLGTAYIHGFKWALKHKYEYIFEMDADFSHNPDDLVRLYDAVKNNADVSVGSRYINGGGVVNWPLERKLLSYGASLYVRLVTLIPCKDSTAGFVCYRRKVLETIDLDNIKFIGYAFQIEMKFNAWKHGFSIVEVPIIFKDRELGVSKMSIHIMREAVLGVLSIQCKSFFKNYHKVQ
jgi:dolichol-phosphate mannosyltransferase